MKSPPEPNSSATEPTFLEADADAWTGRGARGAGTGAGRLAWNLDPDTAEDTVWETRGAMLETTWDTMLSELALLEKTVVERGAAGRGAGADVRLDPDTAEDTVCEIRG